MYFIRCVDGYFNQSFHPWLVYYTNLWLNYLCNLCWTEGELLQVDSTSSMITIFNVNFLSPATNQCRLVLITILPTDIFGRWTHFDYTPPNQVLINSSWHQVSCEMRADTSIRDIWTLQVNRLLHILKTFTDKWLQHLSWSWIRA